MWCWLRLRLQPRLGRRRCCLRRRDGSESGCESGEGNINAGNASKDGEPARVRAMLRLRLWRRPRVRVRAKLKQKVQLTGKDEGEAESEGDSEANAETEN